MTIDASSSRSVRHRDDSTTVCVVTGATRGIGRATARVLAGRGCRVLAVVRDLDDGVEVARAIDGDVRPLQCDLSSLRQVRRLADEILAGHEAVHVLVNNAAAVFDTYGETEDGLERQLAINHVAPFLLTSALLPRLVASAPARILTVSSSGHARGWIHFDDLNLRHRYGALTAYRQSKLANVLFTRELARRLAGTGVTANSLDPGRVRTRIGSAHTTGWIRWLWPLLWPVQVPPDRPASWIADLALDDAWEQTSGAYFVDGRRARAADRARRAGVARRLWRTTDHLVRPFLDGGVR